MKLFLQSILSTILILFFLLLFACGDVNTLKDDKSAEDFRFQSTTLFRGEFEMPLELPIDDLFIKRHQVNVPDLPYVSTIGIICNTRASYKSKNSNKYR